MPKGSWKKALVLQSLFFCGLCWAQTPRWLQPRANQPLQNPQRVAIAAPTDGMVRAELYLNGKLQQARRRPPLQFELTWNTALDNTLKVIVRYTNRAPIILVRSFRQIAVDVETDVENTAMFPFLSEPLARAELQLRRDGDILTPLRLEPASSLPLDLTLVLDVSGSMQPVLPSLDAPLATFLKPWRQQANRLRLIAFDSDPRAIDTDPLPQSIAYLQRGLGQSVVWDALATAVAQFDRTARKIVVLISDGADNGSQHTQDSVARYLRETGTALIWVSPTGRRDKALRDLCERSGGFVFLANEPDTWQTLQARLQHQVYLLAPGPATDLQLRVQRGKVWYPRW